MDDDILITGKNILMQELNYYTNDKQMQHPQKDSHQKLIKHDLPARYSFEYQHTEKKTKKQNVDINRVIDIQNQVQNEPDYCYPKFLTCIGNFFTPCKIVLPCCFCSCCPCTTNPLFRQPVQSQGLLQQWGKFQRILEPGLHVINPISQSIIQINRQTKILQYSQVGISKDNVQFKLTIVLFYRVIDSLKLAYRLGSYDLVECIKEIATGTLRSVLGQNLLQTIIQNRQLITGSFTGQINRILDYWGIHIEITSLKEIFLDEDVTKALQSIAETKRLSQALLINFRAEVECSKLIKEVSQIINNEASFQMRYLNAVSQIINNGNQNIIFINTELNHQAQYKEKERVKDEINQKTQSKRENKGKNPIELKNTKNQYI